MVVSSTIQQWYDYRHDHDDDYDTDDDVTQDYDNENIINISDGNETCTGDSSDIDHNSVKYGKLSLKPLSNRSTTRDPFY